MAELADAHDSGSCVRTNLQVQVLFPAPTANNPNHLFLIGKGFGLFFSQKNSERLSPGEGENDKKRDAKLHPMEFGYLENHFGTADTTIYLS